MKKIFILLFAMVFSIGFIGCDKDSGSSYSGGGYYSGGNGNGGSGSGGSSGSGVTPTADFQYNTGASMKVTFTNRSSNANSYLWNFGDGTTSSAVSPNHTYVSRGQKYVTLTAYNGNKSSVAYAYINLYSILRLSNVSSNPYTVYLDGVNMGTLSGGYYSELEVNPGVHTVRVIQNSGYVFYATDETYEITCAAGYRITQEFPESSLGKSATPKVEKI